MDPVRIVPIDLSGHGLAPSRSDTGWVASSVGILMSDHKGVEARSRSATLLWDGPRAADRIGRLAEQAGLTIRDSLHVADEVPETALSADVVLIEVDHEPGAAFDRLLERVDAAAASGRSTAIVTIMPELIDRTMAHLASNVVTLMCNASPVERVAGIELALARPRDRLGEGAGHDEAAELRAIGDELERMSRTIVAMADRSVERSVPAMPSTGAAGGMRAVTAQDFRRMIRQRRLREQYLSSALFADPAWDILLDLSAARLEARMVAVSSLCIAAAVPATTALRWIRLLTQEGILVRRPDPADGRRLFMSLSEPTATAMLAYAEALLVEGGI